MNRRIPRCPKRSRVGRSPFSSWGQSRADDTSLHVASAYLGPAPANREPAQSSVPELETSSPIPRPDHTVVVILENHAYSDVIGNASAPYINFLKNTGANFTDSHG